jgi:hypothetical protein
MASSSPNMPGASPGARIHDGTATSSGTSRWDVRRAAPAYMLRVTTVVCSANSLIREVCSTASWLIARIRPSTSAPSRTRWNVGVR